MKELYLDVLIYITKQIDLIWKLSSAKCNSYFMNYAVKQKMYYKGQFNQINLYERRNVNVSSTSRLLAIQGKCTS